MNQLFRKMSASVLPPIINTGNQSTVLFMFKSLTPVMYHSHTCQNANNFNINEQDVIFICVEHEKRLIHVHTGLGKTGPDLLCRH